MTEQEKTAFEIINKIIDTYGLEVEIENNVVIPKPPKG